MNTDSPETADLLDLATAGPAEFEAVIDTEFIVDRRYLGINESGMPLLDPHAYPDQSECRLKLVEVTRQNQLAERLRKHPFTLLFCGSHDEPLFQGAHLLRHNAFGNSLLFLSMIQAEVGVHPSVHPDGLFYECVFN